MKITHLAGVMLATLLALAGCKPSPNPPQGPALAGNAVAQSVYITGTLCSGGFECQWSPVATQLDVTRHRLFVLADRAQISKADAQPVQDLLAQVHTALQDSKDACVFDGAGNCTKDAQAATESLELAVRVLTLARQSLDSVAH